MALCDITCNVQRNNEILSDFYVSLAFLILLDCKSALELIPIRFKGTYYILQEKVFPFISQKILPMLYPVSDMLSVMSI